MLFISSLLRRCSMHILLMAVLFLVSSSAAPSPKHTQPTISNLINVDVEHELVVRIMRFIGDSYNPVSPANLPLENNHQLGLLIGKEIFRFLRPDPNGKLKPILPMFLNSTDHNDKDEKFFAYMTRSGDQKNAMLKKDDVIAFFGNKDPESVFEVLRDVNQLRRSSRGRPWEMKSVDNDADYIIAVLDYLAALPSTAGGHATVLYSQNETVKKMKGLAEKLKQHRTAARHA
ncbi:uncharacterized protein C8R40DRAFT_1266726 [Lentinula edodes]|uniref:uncharacterized protein n=1 Tax=Lentinula edodes TaxID=5353 RepID=UPI001E8EBFF8|nr:uncharacterized protein C8R40DRAFT_1266726 [Lentinula edodes]KAH7872870.1 hypothetical protein C8R40DRAFT_1266726 [Lentinula edodes]